jgi:hypothetical protein
MEDMGRQNDRGKGSGNHGNSRKGRSKSRPRNIECWNCGKKGHLKKDYRAPKKQRYGQQEKNMEENIIGDVLQDDFIIFVDNIFESLVVDSGANNNNNNLFLRSWPSQHTKLVYETPLFMGQGTPSTQRFDW